MQNRLNTDNSRNDLNIITASFGKTSGASNFAAISFDEMAFELLSGVPKEHWQATLPSEISQALIPLQKLNNDQVHKSDLSYLNELLKNPALKEMAIESLNRYCEDEYETGPRLALTLVLIQSPNPSDLIIETVLKQTRFFPKDKELLTAIGQVLDKQDDQKLKQFEPLLIQSTLDNFLQMRTYGGDKSLTGLENVFSRLHSDYVTTELYKELNFRAQKGVQSGYQHILNLLNKTDLSLSAPIYSKLVDETAIRNESQPLAPKVTFAMHATRAMSRALIYSAIATGVVGWDKFFNSYIPLLTIIIPHIREAVSMLRESSNSLSNSEISCKPTKVTLALKCIDLVAEKSADNDQARKLMELFNNLSNVDATVSEHIKSKSESSDVA